MTRSRKFGILLAAAVAGTVPSIGGAGAQTTLACGQTVTQSTTLTVDIGPCPNNGIVVGADGITLDLGGSANTVRRITAQNNIGASFGRPGATSTLYGDGILVQGPASNSIVDNVADNNGPFSGIGVIQGDSDHPAVPPAPAPFNLIQGNVVTNNIACRAGLSPFCDNDGIRIEPKVTDARILANNVPGTGWTASPSSAS